MTPSLAALPLLAALSATPAGEAVVYTPATLVDRIDGGAELVKEHGFVELSVRRYTVGGDAGDARLEVDRYQMRDPLGALGLYLDRCGSETPDPTLVPRHTVGRYQLLMLCGDAVAVVTNPAGDEALVPAMVDLARDLCPRPPDPPPDPFGLLPARGLDPSSRRIVRGPVGLAAFATLGDGDVLRLGGDVHGVAGLYPGPEGTVLTRVVVDYRDAGAAAAVLVALRNAVDRDPYLVAGPLTEGAPLTWTDWASRRCEARIDGAVLTISLGLPAEPR